MKLYDYLRLAESLKPAIVRSWSWQAVKQGLYSQLLWSISGEKDGAVCRLRNICRASHWYSSVNLEAALHQFEVFETLPPWRDELYSRCDGFKHNAYGPPRSISLQLDYR